MDDKVFLQQISPNWVHNLTVFDNLLPKCVPLSSDVELSEALGESFWSLGSPLGPHG